MHAMVVRGIWHTSTADERSPFDGPRVRSVFIDATVPAIWGARSSIALGGSGMVISAPTRITIEVTQLQPVEHGQPAAAPLAFTHVAMSSAAPTDTSHHPPAYEPAPCRCLDEDDCVADHEHE